MRLVKLSVIAAVLSALALAAGPVDYVAQFELFKRTHKREYATASEEARRLGYFIRNMQKAAQLQALNPHARFGANEFADLSEAEFKPHHNAEGHFRAAIRARRGAAGKGKSDDTASSASVATSVGVGGGSFTQQQDWRSQGAVTPVKNQGYHCGSCWSFSTTGNIEGQWALAGNALVSLSEQELVSCDDTCNACHGGLPDLAFEWVVAARGGGLTSESQYPYVSGNGAVPACDMAGKTDVTWIQGHKDIAHSESAMAEFVATGGPLSIGVDAASWQTYGGGVMTNCQATQVDHAVLIVGYDLTAQPPYWIIKNSWGVSWGEEGYIRLQYGQNECLITTLPSTSIAAGSHPPSPPSPPSPPTPPTPPSTGSFSQYVCPGAFCLSDCQKHTFPTGVCLTLSAGGSAVASCGANNLNLQVYQSSDCTGSSQAEAMPLNTCEQDSNGSYTYNTCTSSSAAFAAGANKVMANVTVPRRQRRGGQ